MEAIPLLLFCFPQNILPDVSQLISIKIPVPFYANVQNSLRNNNNCAFVL